MCFTSPCYGGIGYPEGIPKPVWEASNSTSGNLDLESVLQELLDLAKRRKRPRGIDPGFDPSVFRPDEMSINSFEDLL
jgi:hypothetical protein